jgi:glycerol-3-phosphate acyltransferase PlsX
VSLAAPAAPSLSGLWLLRKATGDAARFLHQRGEAVATVAVDAHGADLGPAEVAHGALAAARTGTSCVIYGPREEIERVLGPQGAAGLELVDAPVAITNAEEPARAARAKPDASIVQAARALADGRAEALVSAGSTGAALAAALLHVKRLPGVFRPAIAVPVPTPAGRVLLLDAGANVEVRPEHLVQFAYMGAAFSERVLGVERPRVALLSVGAERGKGTVAVVAAHEQLASAPGLEFIGNVEGDEVPAGKSDVVVTDGFTGNDALKLMEGTARSVETAVRAAARSGPLAMVGGLLLRPKLSGLRKRLDPEAVGGAYLLGLRGLVVICHGRSTRHAIANAIALAERGVEQAVIGKTAAALAESPVSRRQPASVPADTVKISP